MWAYFLAAIERLMGWDGRTLYCGLIDISKNSCGVGILPAFNILLEEMFDDWSETNNFCDNFIVNYISFNILKVVKISLYPDTQQQQSRLASFWFLPLATPLPGQPND
ncbi:hypothetical protein H6S82_31130 [Planktothrix sp. FACHB-1355]|uniref:Uncharacterized protein n=1 Tax=Aerosakkonema funiforme FACHB-1375 TaxID=2949571 RepID=A0A926VK30_9CYAN|nr:MULTISPECIES: hypothetical protein [Oscillatoriales]MBD2185265.1 hypothetical protein [Aerosakkonema funiforme FACHB-1375]MBD3563259.1 hypothetical protein [Planktothrix sp. FACHB-1355]